MSFIQLMVNLLKVKSGVIMIYAVNTFLLILLSYLLYGYDQFLYPVSISIFILVVYLIIAGFKLYAFTKKMNEAKSSPHMEVDELNVEDTLIFGTMNDIHDKYNQHIYKMNSAFKERNTLFSQWIHNMKVSISIIALASEKGSEDAIEDIKEENMKLKQNLEECLNVLRLDDFSRDYMPEKVNIHSIVTQVINTKKRDFIYQGVYPKIEIDPSVEVYTDQKWCSYIIEQILSNAIKYSEKNQNVTITSLVKSDEISLIIKDHGVGIAKEDLPRVFDPFFTGKNGRSHSSATGIGLYMVKYISQKLGHGLHIDSQEGVGTEVTLSFLSKM